MDRSTNSAAKDLATPSEKLALGSLLALISPGLMVPALASAALAGAALASATLALGCEESDELRPAPVPDTPGNTATLPPTEPPTEGDTSSEMSSPDDLSADDDLGDDDLGDDDQGDDDILDSGVPPTSAAELQTWLSAGRYVGWSSEERAHPSAGPHYGAVRVWVNPILEASLLAASEDHPVGSAAVKELYGQSQLGGTALGYSVILKVGEGTSGNDWYWYEAYTGNVVADGTGEVGCTSCHAGGRDYFRSTSFRP